MRHFIRLFCYLYFVLVLISCAALNSSPIPAGTQKVISQAHENHFITREVNTPTFKLSTLEKIQAPEEASTHVYIEGDGNSWKTRYQLSDNPTPKQPLALKLALQDTHPNVIYIARPCQYTPLATDPCCEPKFWSSHRYAPEVITAVNAVLDHHLQRRQATTWVLVGFSGGASVATLVASERQDVARLITVAGDLNHDLLNQYHGTTPLRGSLNPSDALQQVQHIPQTHWCGTKDSVVPCWTVSAFCEKVNNPDLVRCKSLKGASHHAKWEQAWPTLLSEALHQT